MNGITFSGNVKAGMDFAESVRGRDFLFALAASYTETCEVPGITIAGAVPQMLKFTPAADAEFLHYGACKCIESVPMTPDGKPTPALITRAALEHAGIPAITINAGSRVAPQVPFIHTGLEHGKNIQTGPAMSRDSVLRAVDSGRMIGRTLASAADCLVIGESMPGGTTTSLALMRGMGIDARVSSSMPENPTELKENIARAALERLDGGDPVDVAAQAGDPMIPTVAGMLGAASETAHVILAGGTQMAAVLAFAQSVGFQEANVAIGTTSYVADDGTANLTDTVKQIADVPVLVIDPGLDSSRFEGLESFSKGFAKEGAGAGGSLIASVLKSDPDHVELLPMIERQYQRLFT